MKPSLKFSINNENEDDLKTEESDTSESSESENKKRDEISKSKHRTYERKFRDQQEMDKFIYSKKVVSPGLSPILSTDNKIASTFKEISILDDMQIQEERIKQNNYEKNELIKMRRLKDASKGNKNSENLQVLPRPKSEKIYPLSRSLPENLRYEKVNDEDMRKTTREIKEKEDYVRNFKQKIIDLTNIPDDTEKFESLKQLVKSSRKKAEEKDFQETKAQILELRRKAELQRKKQEEQFKKKLPPITTEEQEIIFDALDSEGDEEEVISDGFNIKLTRGQLSCLRDCEWLNDEVYFLN